MTLPIDYFRSSGPGTFHMGVGETSVRLAVCRDLWFDRDIEGRWLVVADRHAPPSVAARRDVLPDKGAIVVRDPTVLAYIDLLAQLYTEPGAFADEPLFVPPKGHDRDR